MNAQSNSQNQDVAVATTQENFDQAYAALAEEHTQIMALLVVLKEAPDPFSLVRPLEELHTLLINHFAHEQFPGGAVRIHGCLRLALA